MKRFAELGVVSVSLAALWAAPSAGLDSTKCKAKISPKLGVILVEAKGVVGNLLWAPRGGYEIFPLFNNSGDCVTPGDPKKCELGPPDSVDRIYPPETCSVYLRDTGDSTTCQAYIKKCVPGRRPCPEDMVDAGGFCIDKYEASVWSGMTTGAVQYGAGSDNYPCTDNGQNCNNIYARSILGVKPSVSVTWFQAQQACRNAGKRLPTSAEWQQAVAGTPDPGGDNGTTDCNTASAGAAVNTGSRGACISLAGAFDMVGNVDEWVADWVPLSTGCPGWGGGFSNDLMCLSGASTTETTPGALQRGGAFFDAATAGPFFVAAELGPSFTGAYIGFRCAR